MGIRYQRLLGLRLTGFTCQASPAEKRGWPQMAQHPCAHLHLDMMAMLLLTDCTGGQPVTLPSLQSPIRYPSSAVIEGQIHSPGGPFLYDQEGRVVFFHGVNAVYSTPPTSLPCPR